VKNESREFASVIWRDGFGVLGCAIIQMDGQPPTELASGDRYPYSWKFGKTHYAWEKGLDREVEFWSKGRSSQVYLGLLKPPTIFLQDRPLEISTSCFANVEMMYHYVVSAFLVAHDRYGIWSETDAF